MSAWPAWAWEGGGGCLARGARGGAGRSHHQKIKRENSFRIIRREAGNRSTRETVGLSTGWGGTGKWIVRSDALS